MKKKKLLFILLTVLLIPVLDIRKGICNELNKCIKLLRSSDSQKRMYGLAAFTKFDRKVSHKNIGLIIPLLYDKVEGVRDGAIYSIRVVFLEPSKYNVLRTPHFQMPRLEKDDEYIKAAEQVLPHLIEKLKNEKESLQNKALMTIVAIGMIDNNLDVIIEKLDSESENVRYHALVALGNIGKESKKAIPKIEDMIKNDESRPVRDTAENALRLILGLDIIIDNRSELDKCIERLQNKDPKHRYQGLLAFLRLDRKTCQENIELIIPLLYDEDEGIRKTAIDISQYIFLKPPVNNFLAITFLRPPRLEKDAAYIKAAKLLSPHLIAKLKTESELLQLNTLLTIACIGVTDNNDVDVIIDKLGSENDKFRTYALLALGNLGKEAQKAIPRIEDMMKNDESNLVRDVAKNALMMISEDQP